MPKVDIVRAWKDEDYRLGLSEDERAQLPESPAGLVELNDSDLNGAAGGIYPWPIPMSFMDCPSWDFCPNPSNITYCPSYNYCPSNVTVCPVEEFYYY